MSKRSSATDLPLIEWGDALRRAADRHRRLRRRFFAVGLGIGVLIATAALPPTPRFVWNASESAPLGLYAVAPGAVVRVGDMVIARTPIGVRHLAAVRRYVPENVPLVKRVTGEPGDIVCAVGPIITVNTRIVAVRRAVDGQGRPMPWWRGCVALRDGALLLLMPGSANSFDGRYFGPTDAKDIIGKARLLWRR